MILRIFHMVIQKLFFSGNGSGQMPIIIATIVVGLVYTPIMLRLLGQSEYGLYSLMGSLVGYLSVLDMGLGNTIVRYTAKNRADGTAEIEGKLNGLFLFI